MQKGNRRSGTHYRQITMGGNEREQRNRRVGKKNNTESKDGDHSHSACHSPHPSLPLLVFWDSDQQKACCETGLEQKLALKTKASVKKWTCTSELTSKPKITQDNFFKGLL